MRQPKRRVVRRAPVRRIESKLINSRGGSRPWTRITRDFVAVHQICWLRFPGCTMRAVTIDHYHTRKHRPDLADKPWNWRPACDRCNLRRGATPPHLIEKLREQLEAKAARHQQKALRFFK